MNQELVRVLDQNAYEIIEQVNNVNAQDYTKLRSVLYMDQNSQTFPFMTILLFLRAGLESYISPFCSNSTSKAVQDFGEEYKKYSATNGKLSLSQIQEYTQSFNKIAEGELCLRAIVSILTGNIFDHPVQILLTKYLLNI